MTILIKFFYRYHCVLIMCVCVFFFFWGRREKRRRCMLKETGQEQVGLT